MSSMLTDINVACEYYEKRKQYQKDYYQNLKHSKTQAGQLANRISDLEAVIAAKEANIKELTFIKNNLNIELHRNISVYNDLKKMNEKLQTDIDELRTQYKDLKVLHDRYLIGTQLFAEFVKAYPQEYQNLIRKLKNDNIVDPGLRSFVQSQNV